MKNSFYVILLTILASSCTLSKKRAAAISKIQEHKKEENDFRYLVDTTLKLTFYEVYHGEIDETIGKNISDKMDSIKTVSDQNLMNADKLLAMLESRKRKERKAAIEQTDAFLNSSLEFIGDKKEQMLFLKELYQLPTLKTFATATFFGSGKYEIPADALERVKKDFSPVIDEMIAFANRNPDKVMLGLVVTRGFADGQAINPEGNFAKLLSEKANLSNADSPRLNQALSQFRADEVVQVLKIVFEENQGQLTKKESIRYIDFRAEGKGEELPNKDIKDYQADDERRRIVTVLWNIIPSEFLKK